jgi:hypothetical protein
LLTDVLSLSDAGIETRYCSLCLSGVLVVSAFVLAGS